MKTVYVITHPEVVIDPKVPVPRWPLSEKGRERMQGLLHAPWLRSVTAVYSSDEQKALDGANILAQAVGVQVATVPTIGEVDRSSTGYLPQEKHDLNAKLLFDHPHDSIDGWEAAIEAQYRMVTSVYRILEFDKTDGTIVIVTHGAVGSFLMSHLKRRKISREDEPGIPGGGGIFSFNGSTREVLSDWHNIDVYAPEKPVAPKPQHQITKPTIPLPDNLDGLSETRV